MFSAALVLFDNIPTSLVSKHHSVGLILLQRRSSDAVAAQRRCIPKCTFFFPRGEKIVWRIFFLRCKKTKATSGWLVKKYLSVNYFDFLTPTDAVTENPHKYLAAEKYY
jgi:hypothetical protein